MERQLDDGVVRAMDWRAPGRDRGQGEHHEPPRRGSIDGWSVAATAPKLQLKAFDNAIGDLHAAVAWSNHELWGDPVSGRVLDRVVQLRRRLGAADDDEPRPVDPRAVAASGLVGTASALPHAEAIQASFGRHDVGSVRAFSGPSATRAATALGAEAYATGDAIAFAGRPSLHTAAHEAAHVVQQRAGVSLAGGVGAAGDVYERHADAVADRVVQGRSAEDLLDRFVGGGGASAGGAPANAAAIQKKGAGFSAVDQSASKTESSLEDVSGSRDNLVAELDAGIENADRELRAIHTEWGMDVPPERVARRCEALEKKKKHLADAKAELAHVPEGALDMATLQRIAKGARVGVDVAGRKATLSTSVSRGYVAGAGLNRSSSMVHTSRDGKTVTYGRSETIGAGVGKVAYTLGEQGAAGESKREVSVGERGLTTTSSKTDPEKNNRTTSHTLGAKGYERATSTKDAAGNVRGGKLSIGAGGEDTGYTWSGGDAGAKLPGDKEASSAKTWDAGLTTRGAHANGAYDFGKAPQLGRIPGLRTFKIGGGVSVRVKSRPGKKKGTVVLSAVASGTLSLTVGNEAIGQTDSRKGAGSVTGSGAVKVSRTVERTYTEAEAWSQLGRLTAAEKRGYTTLAEWRAAVPLLFGDVGDKVGDVVESREDRSLEGAAKLGGAATNVSVSGSLSRGFTVRRERVSAHVVRVSITVTDAQTVKGGGDLGFGDAVTVGDVAHASATTSGGLSRSRAESHGETFGVDIDTRSPAWRLRMDDVARQLGQCEDAGMAKRLALRLGATRWKTSSSQTDHVGVTGEAQVSGQAGTRQISASAGVDVGTTTTSTSEVEAADGKLSSKHTGATSFAVEGKVMGVAVGARGPKSGGSTSSAGEAGAITLEREDRSQSIDPSVSGWKDVNGVAGTVYNVVTRESKAVAQHSFGAGDVNVLIARAADAGAWDSAGSTRTPQDNAAWRALGRQLRSPLLVDEDGLAARVASSDAPAAVKARLRRELEMALRMRAVARWLTRGEVAHSFLRRVLERPGETWSASTPAYERRGTRIAWPHGSEVVKARWDKLEGEVAALEKRAKSDPELTQNPAGLAVEVEDVRRSIFLVAYDVDRLEGVDGATLGDMRGTLEKLRQRVAVAAGERYVERRPVSSVAGHEQAQRDTLKDAVARCEAFKASEDRLKAQIASTWLAKDRYRLLMTDVSSLYERWVPEVLRARKAATALNMNAKDSPVSLAGYQHKAATEPDRTWFADQWRKDARAGEENTTLVLRLQY